MARLGCGEYRFFRAVKDALVTQCPNFCDMMWFTSPVLHPVPCGHWSCVLGGNVLDLGLQDGAQSA